MSDRLTTEIEKIPLSGDDLIDIAKCIGTSRVKWMLYDDLKDIKNVQQLFGENIDAIYILLLIKNQEDNVSSVGHWVTFLFHRERREYYWYDPYGLRIAKELDITQEPDFIIKITKGINIHENIIQHQKFSSEINTCGRHCVLRSVFYHLNNKEYNSQLINPMVPIPIREADSLVALMTGLASKSDRTLINFFNKKSKLDKKTEVN